jgi:hypothetical protein
MSTLISRIISTLQRWANWKAIAILAALFLIFDFFILPAAKAYPGEENLPVLDLKFWYMPQQAYQAIAEYGPEARRSAAWMHLTIDVAYPLVYGLLLSLSLAMVFRGAAPQQSQLLLFPWRAVIADYLENAGLVAMFLLYPSQFPFLAWITAVFTALKWLQIGFSFLALLVGSLLLLLGRAKNRV